MQRRAHIGGDALFQDEENALLNRSRVNTDGTRHHLVRGPGHQRPAPGGGELVDFQDGYAVIDLEMAGADPAPVSSSRWRSGCGAQGIPWSQTGSW